jgi:hypothetical protein
MAVKRFSQEETEVTEVGMDNVGGHPPTVKSGIGSGAAKRSLCFLCFLL